MFKSLGLSMGSEVGSRKGEMVDWRFKMEDLKFEMVLNRSVRAGGRVFTRSLALAETGLQY